MKTYESLKDFYPKLNSMLGEIDIYIKDNIKKIKKEFETKLIEEKIQLLKIICKDESLNFNEIKDKYLTDKEKKYIKVSDMPKIDNEKLLDTISIDGITYFYENKENGKVFNTKSKTVGYMSNGVAILN
jgi:hypothetical protein